MAKITVQAHPGAKHSEITRCVDGVWHIRIAAPPVKGKANNMLIEFLSEILDVPRSHIMIEKGTTAQRKLVAIEGLTRDQVEEKLITKKQLLSP